MSSVLVMVAAATVGVDYGWQPVAGGGYEYIIQIEPDMLDTIRNGTDIISELPLEYRQAMRRYRVTVGTDLLPHQGEPPPPLDESETAAADDVDQVGPPTEAPALTDPATGDPVEMARNFGGDGTDDEQAGAGATERTVGYPNSGDASDSADDDGEDQDAADGADDTAGAAAADAESEAPPPSDDGDAAAGVTLSSTIYYGALVGLIASAAGNIYLLWVAVSQRGRYRAMVARTRPV